MPRGLVPRVRRGKPAAGVACRAPVTRACSLCVGEGKHPPLHACRNIRRVVGVGAPTNSNKDFESSLARHCVLVGVVVGDGGSRGLPDFASWSRGAAHRGGAYRRRSTGLQFGVVVVVVRYCATALLRYRPALLRYCATALQRYLTSSLSLHCYFVTTVSNVVALLTT